MRKAKDVQALLQSQLQSAVAPQVDLRTNTIFYREAKSNMDKIKLVFDLSRSSHTAGDDRGASRGSHGQPETILRHQLGRCCGRFLNAADIQIWRQFHHRGRQTT
jgi:hypothetical protein